MHLSLLSHARAVAMALIIGIFLSAASISGNTKGASMGAAKVDIDAIIASVKVEADGMKEAEESKESDELIATVDSEHGAARKEKSRYLPVVANAVMTEKHKQLSDAVLRKLPSDCRKNLKNYYVRYDNPERRGLGGATTVILDGTVPDEEFIGLLIHECSHVTHGNLGGSELSGESPFSDNHQTFYNDSPMAAFFSISWSKENIRKKGSTKADFASGYGQSDAFEDYAEAFALYVLHRDAFRARALENDAMKAKLEWMETYMNLPENIFGESEYVWNGVVPWDVTRLPISL